MLGSPVERGYKSPFIELFNEQSTDYAMLGYSEAGPDFAFLRYLGNRVMEIMIEKDQSWVIDQIMENEAPQAVADIRKGMRGLFDSTPRPARRERLSGD